MHLGWGSSDCNFRHRPSFRCEHNCHACELPGMVRLGQGCMLLQIHVQKPTSKQHITRSVLSYQDVHSGHALWQAHWGVHGCPLSNDALLTSCDEGCIKKPYRTQILKVAQLRTQGVTTYSRFVVVVADFKSKVQGSC